MKEKDLILEPSAKKEEAEEDDIYDLFEVMESQLEIIAGIVAVDIPNVEIEKENAICNAIKLIIGSQEMMMTDLEIPFKQKKK